MQACERTRQSGRSQIERRAHATLLVTILMVTLAGCRGRSNQPATAAAPPPPPAVSEEAKRRSAPVPIERTSPALPEPSVEGLGSPVLTEIGLASWYGPPYHNRKAADGSIFDENALTAAHRTLPMGSTVRVTNLATGQAVVVRITDRGPFIEGRTLDLSLAAAKAIGIYRAGVAKVKVEAFAHPSANPAGRWCVQIGVFIDPADAMQVKNDLASRYSKARVIEFAGPTGHWVRITTASADRMETTRIADAIHLPDAFPFLVRLD